MQDKTLVIKIGSSVLFTGRGKLDEFRVLSLIDQINELHNRNIFVVLVLSGAIACGSNLPYQSRGRVPDRALLKTSIRVLAGVGQALFISKLLTLFSQKGLTISQILLTKNEWIDKCDQLVTTIKEMCTFGIIPIVNENDVVELNSFGGNDVLASRIAEIMRSPLIILSSMDSSRYGVGGGKTKLEAVAYLKTMGLPALIKDGKQKDCLMEDVYA